MNTGNLKPAGSMDRKIERVDVRRAQIDLDRTERAYRQMQDSIVADVKAGKTKAIGAVIGPVMKASGGSANPQLVRETLLRLIESEH